MPQLLWLLLILVPHLAAAVADSSLAPAPSSLPGCPSKCGQVDIPYPFGIGAHCAWQGEGGGFTVHCNESSSPPTPRPYIGNIEIMNISVETGEMHVFTPIAYRCFNSSTTIESQGTIGWDITEPLRISTTKNIFTAIGCHTVALVEGFGESTYMAGCISYCEEDFVNEAKDGELCTGLGCCQTTSIPAKLTKLDVNWGNTSADDSYNPAWKYSPCSYAFVAAKPWYNFKRADLGLMDEESRNSRFGESNVPFVLDWAITKNGSCQVEGPHASGASGKLTAPACVNANSECDIAAEGDGYLCVCSKGYHGNPYIHGGCQDIDECDLRKQNPKVYTEMYPCATGSTCKNTQGDYECKCNNKFWLKGDGRSDKGCESRISVPVIAAVAIVLAVAVACLSIILFVRIKEKKRVNQNGGKILKAQGITTYTKRALKNITKSYSKRLGEGYFGEVYEGTIDGTAQRVAVKCSKEKRVGMVRRWQKMSQHEVQQNEVENDGFVNEIIFQFKIKHANVVQLLGCCLETDIPILVFEFVPNGSLEDVLHGANKTCTLSLLKRLDIAIGSAEAISHMHSQGDCIHVHGDVKPANILLDKDLKPKVSDFGSSRLLSIDSYTRAVAADRKYMDPVCYKTGRFTVKSDVYSFGLVLLELITRKTVRYDGNKSLSLDFVKCFKDDGDGRKMYDRDILIDDNAQSHVYMECLDKIGVLAVRCIKEDVEERPTMPEVVEELKNVKLITFGNSDSEDAS